MLNIRNRKKKEEAIEGETQSYQWLSTKEMEMAEGLRQLLKERKCEMVKEEVNKVICENEEIKMLNIRNRKKKAEVREGGKRS